MAAFWTRTRRYLAIVWLGAAALEAVVLVLANRTNNSWFLLLALAILVIPIVASDRTVEWLRRPARKRWKRHDLEMGIPVASSPVPPPASAPPSPLPPSPPPPMASASAMPPPTD
jgi:hypothetical protein